MTLCTAGSPCLRPVPAVDGDQVGRNGRGRTVGAGRSGQDDQSWGDLDPSRAPSLIPCAVAQEAAAAAWPVAVELEVPLDPEASDAGELEELDEAAVPALSPEEEESGLLELEEDEPAEDAESVE